MALALMTLVDLTPHRPAWHQAVQEARETMAAQEPDNGTAVPEVLALLADLPIVTAVTLQGPGTHGGIHIIVRKTAQQQEGRTHYRYAWEVRVGAAGQAWERAEGPAYESAATAYQAAVAAM